VPSGVALIAAPDFGLVLTTTNYVLDRRARSG
jgi:hypothetical protein